MQQFYRVTPVYCKGNYIVLPKGYNSYKLQFMVHTVMSRVIYNPGNIIRYCQVLTDIQVTTRSINQFKIYCTNYVIIN